MEQTERTVNSMTDIFNSPTVITRKSDKTCDLCGVYYKQQVLKDDHGELIVNEYLACDCARMKIAGITDMVFDNFDRRREPDAYDVALSYSQNPNGWLVFVGINGSGKTHLASAIVHILKDCFNFSFITCSNILEYAKRNEWNYDKFKVVELLVMDELGLTIDSEWARSVIYDIISFRERSQAPTIFTTNFNSMELHSKIGSASVDRILGMSKIVKMQSKKSYRLERAGF